MAHQVSGLLCASWARLGMPIESIPLRGFIASAWAEREALRVTDACYVAVARGMDAPLLTTGTRLERGAKEVAFVKRGGEDA